MDTLQKLIDLYDNRSACAKALGISPQRLNGWIKTGYIPYQQGPMIEKATKRKIKASEVWQAASQRMK